MAVIKVFDSIGVKTVELMGNMSEQDYDEFVDEPESLDDLINESAETTDDGF